MHIYEPWPTVALRDGRLVGTERRIQTAHGGGATVANHTQTNYIKHSSTLVSRFALLLHVLASCFLRFILLRDYKEWLGTSTCCTFFTLFCRVSLFVAILLMSNRLEQQCMGILGCVEGGQSWVVPCECLGLADEMRECMQWLHKENDGKSSQVQWSAGVGVEIEVVEIHKQLALCLGERW